MRNFITGTKERLLGTEKQPTTLRYLPGEIPKATGTIGKAIGRFGTEVLRAIPRAGGQVGLHLTGQKEFIPGRGVVPKLEKTLFGERPIKTVPETGRELLGEFGVSPETATKYALPVGLGAFALDILPPVGPGMGKGVAKKAVAKPSIFKGLKNLSTKLLEKFRGLPNKIKPGRAEEIINLTKKQGLKPVEEKIFRSSIVTEKGMVNLPKTAAKIEEQLVPLKATSVKSPRWSYIGEEFIGDGKYGEIVYQSPIKTSAGDVHFAGFPATVQEARFRGGKLPQSFPNYFSHVRYEDIMPSAKETITGIRGIGRLKTGGGGTRKILEIQSDLFQKGGLERETEGYLMTEGSLRGEELSKLQSYSSNDPLAQLRTFREEVKRAAKDGKNTLLIPSGETAMRIEGLGRGLKWGFKNVGDNVRDLTIPDLEIGKEVFNFDNATQKWIITDILGEGRFRAVPKEKYNSIMSLFPQGKPTLKVNKVYVQNRIMGASETFDISVKVDTQHFVYKLNEEAIPREARKMGLEVEGKISADNGEWWKIIIPSERAKMPVEAYGTGAGLFPLTQKSEEEKKKLKFLNKSTYGKR